MKKCMIMITFILLLTGCSSSEETETVTSITETVDVFYTMEENVLTQLDSEVNLDKYYEDYQIDDYEIYDGTITSGGTYYLSGDYSTCITIDANDEDVRLVLDNVNIKTVGPSILILSADDVTISLVPGSVNYLEDNAIYNNDNLDSVIQGYSDIYINGSGTLHIQANLNNAIYTNDDIKIIESTINITSVDDGIIGNDSVSIKEATITMDVAGDGIVASNADLEHKGYINIESGTFVIKSGEDAIKAVNDIYIYGGDFDIDADDDAIQSDIDIFISGGTFDIASLNDAITCDNMLHIYGGDFLISALDDGLHSDLYLYISGGNINIMNSYEGIESFEIVIDGGDINVYSTDDGLNATAGGGQAHGTEVYISQGGFITINGGDIYINAQSDGVDANGEILITGGNLVVFGSSDDFQSPIDYDVSLTVTGGNLIAVGSTGMIQGVTESNQPSILYADTNTYSAGTVITLYDEDGTVIISVESPKYFTGIVVCNESFESGDVVTLEIDTDTYFVTLNSSEVSVGDGGTTNGSPGGGVPPRR